MLHTDQPRGIWCADTCEYGMFLLALPAGMGGQDSPDVLQQNFLNPPDSAKPRVWWHWMNGNISKEGIKLDLEWMHRVPSHSSRGKGH
jgi:hypothetical protein